MTLAIAKDYQLKFDSLSLRISDNPKHIIENKITSRLSSEARSNNSKLQRPLFRLPVIVEGYVEGKPNSYATISLNTNEFKRKDKVEISVGGLVVATEQEVLSGLCWPCSYVGIMT